MAWNRPSAESAQNVKEKARGNRTITILCICLLSVTVFAVGGIVTWCIYGGRDKPSSNNNHTVSRTIREVTPVATNKVADIVEEVVDRNSLEWRKKHDPRYFIPKGAYRDNRGILRTPTGRRILENMPTRQMYGNGSRKRIFQHTAESEIAKLISLEPGKFFISSTYGPKFAESFKESIISPTLVCKDDDSETAALKREVNAVKADLKARMDSGENIVQIMKDAEKEVRALNEYRNNLQKELRALRYDETLSESDFQDYINAANMMLERKGISKIKFPTLQKEQLQRMRDIHKARLEAESKKNNAIKEN